MPDSRFPAPPTERQFGLFSDRFPIDGVHVQLCVFRDKADFYKIQRSKFV
jgi:hypothetical protein